MSTVITVSNFKLYGHYTLVVSKDTASDITVDIDSSITTNTIGNNILSGANGDKYVIDIYVKSTPSEMYVQFPSLPTNIADASDLAVDGANRRLIVDPLTQEAFNDEADAELIDILSTGVRSGLISTIDGSGTEFSVTSGVGQIVDNTVQTNVLFTKISDTAKASIDPCTNASFTVKYWYYDDNSDVLKETSVTPNPSDYVVRLYVCRTAELNGTILGLEPEVTLSQQHSGLIRELSSAIGIIKIQGIEVIESITSPASLQFGISSGKAFSYGDNLSNSNTNTSTVTTPAIDTGNTDTFKYVTTAGTLAPDETDINVGSYQLAGVVTGVGGAPSQATIHWLWSIGGNIRASYHTAFFSTQTAALSAIQSGEADNKDTVSASFYGESLAIGAIVSVISETSLQNSDLISTNKLQGFYGAIKAATGSFLQIGNNLSDLDNIATSRTNLDVYSKTEVDAITDVLTKRINQVLIFKDVTKYEFGLNVNFKIDSTIQSAGTTSITLGGTATPYVFGSTVTAGNTLDIINNTENAVVTLNGNEL